MNGWIGVDLDGTLAEYHSWPKDGSIGKPIPAMVERVKAWLAEGKDVRIFTARAWPLGTTHQDKEHLSGRRREALEQSRRICDWCIEQFGQTLEITCSKDYGMVELWDDRAVQVIPNEGVTILERVAANLR